MRRFVVVKSLFPDIWIISVLYSCQQNCQLNILVPKEGYVMFLQFLSGKHTASVTTYSV